MHDVKIVEIPTIEFERTDSVSICGSPNPYQIDGMGMHKSNSQINVFVNTLLRVFNALKGHIVALKNRLNIS